MYSVSIVNLFLAKFLSYADQIIMLNEAGEISQRGTYEELRLIDGIVQDNSSNDNDITFNSSGNEGVETTPSYTPNPKETAKNHEPRNTSRQTGDFSVYQYYFACINWKVAAMFLALQVCLGFLSSFPGEYPFSAVKIGYHHCGARSILHLSCEDIVPTARLALLTTYSSLVKMVE
jgi:hypothetical protein